MKAFPKAKSMGFTLTELMIAVTVLGVLVAMGMPSFRQMLLNSKIRAEAESVANGLQRARAEAVSRNAKVQLVLCPTLACVDPSGLLSWYVDYASTPDPLNRIDKRASTEGSAATRTVSPINATTITFNQLGQVVTPNPDASLPFTQIDFNATGGTSLRVTIVPGGAARMCDLSLPLSNSNPRACPLP